MTSSNDGNVKITTRIGYLYITIIKEQGSALPQFRDDVFPGASADKQRMDKRKEKRTDISPNR
jgi:hypothetical protein